MMNITSLFFSGVFSSVCTDNSIDLAEVWPLFQQLPKVPMSHSTGKFILNRYSVIRLFYKVYFCVFQTVLAVIILVNLQGVFAQVKDVPKLWNTDRLDLVRAPNPLILTLLMFHVGLSSRVFQQYY